MRVAIFSDVHTRYKSVKTATHTTIPVIIPVRQHFIQFYSNFYYDISSACICEKWENRLKKIAIFLYQFSQPNRNFLVQHIDPAKLFHSLARENKFLLHMSITI